IDRILFYTFASFPLAHLENAVKQPVVVLNQLKKDMIYLQNLIVERNPELVVGIAKTKYQTQWETTCRNVFHKTKKVSKHNLYDHYDLFHPSPTSFRKNKQPSDTFCNWSMFRLCEFLSELSSVIPLAFVHAQS